MGRFILIFILLAAPALAQSPSASSTADGFAVDGPIDSERFSSDPQHAWRGRADQKSWWWQVTFVEARDVGAILQINGSGEISLVDGPRDYLWQCSMDGKEWEDLGESRVSDEARMFRLHRLKTVRRAKHMRIWVDSAWGTAPALRHVEFHTKTDSAIEFPDWFVVVDTTGEKKLGDAGRAFIPLARSIEGHKNAPAQMIRVAEFSEQFLAVEPRPLCAFLSGNFKDWCQQDRENWRGAAGVLKNSRLPIWASCGGAQGLAILADTGVDKPWDCPHCRDPKNPKTPIYTHIGHTHDSPHKCGDYSACKFERGPTMIRRVEDDAVFAGLEKEFKAVESHCGQIEYVPKGWRLIATAGPGSLTRTQCMRMEGQPVYAAQFHIEMEGTPENSRRIMANFLKLAEKEKRVALPTTHAKP